MAETRLQRRVQPGAIQQRVLQPGDGYTVCIKGTWVASPTLEVTLHFQICVPVDGEHLPVCLSVYLSIIYLFSNLYL